MASRRSPCSGAGSAATQEMEPHIRLHLALPLVRLLGLLVDTKCHRVGTHLGGVGHHPSQSRLLWLPLERSLPLALLPDLGPLAAGEAMRRRDPRSMIT